MNIEEMQKEENFEHEVLDRLKCLDLSDFDYNAVDGSYVDAVLKARDVLLTAYEKEKEKNKRLEKFIENGEYTWKQKYNETFEYFKAELEKEKEKNKELESYCNDVRKEMNEENRRCMLLAVENQDLKEKNKKAIDFINDKNNYFEDGENWQNVLKIKHILEE